ncbi:DUF2510 domain-containing protein [Microbacterium sp. LBN7]|uniref:DUF2510 domain-containing protein n=1 Tax=Microbacterium sp. LBN7 TaxID=3129773 RepID=UPI003248606E
MTTPAGWYDDGSGTLRWWDGQQWTAHVRTEPQPSAPAEPAAPEPPAKEPTPQETTAQIAPESIAPVAAEPVAPVEAVTPSRVAAEPQPFVPPYAIPAQVGYPGAASAPTYPAASVPGYPGAATHLPSPAPARKVSVLGIIGLAVAVLGVVLACVPPVAAIGWVVLGLGFVTSLVSLFLRGAKWPGITGMGVTVFGTVLALGVALLTLGIDSTVEADPVPIATPSERPPVDDSTEGTTDPSEIEGAEMVPFADLAVGDCIPLVEYDPEEEIFEVPVVPCDQPHTDEVYFIYQLDDGDYPGDDAIYELAWDGCAAQFEGFVGLPYEESEFDIYNYTPTKASWSRMDDRTVHCIIYSYEDVTTSLRGTAR